MNVVTFEEHSSVLAAWWGLPTRPRTLIYLDTHLDLQRLSPARLLRLASCESARGVAELRKPHHLYPDEGYGYSLEDFLYPAHRLGRIDRIIWVAPPHVLAGNAAATLERLQQMDGMEFDELLSFRRLPQGWVAGRLLGIELAICDLAHLARMDLPADSLVDIDIDYFIGLPQDAPWQSPRDAFRVLAALPLAPDLVTISRSVTSGFCPLRYRFIADHLGALYEGRTAEADHFDRLYDLDALQRAGAPEAAASGCRSELQGHPNCPATWYLLGLASADPSEAQAARRRAAEVDPAYEASVLREACEFPGRGLPLDLSAVRALEGRLGTEQRNEAEEALAWAALGLLHGHLGRVEASIACYRRATRHFPDHPVLASAVADGLLRARRPDEALPFLQVAAADDKTAAGSHTRMAILFGNARDWTRAHDHLHVASALAPAWTQLLELRGSLHEAAGEHQEAAELRLRYDALRRQGLQLIERMRPN